MTLNATTLRELRRAGACYDRYAYLRNALGPDWEDEQSIPLVTILEINGLRDALWALRATKVSGNALRHFAADCAESVLPIFEATYPGDSRARTAIETARRYADGLASNDALAVATKAAETAVREAETSAWAAKYSAKAAWAPAWAAKAAAWVAGDFAWTTGRAAEAAAKVAEAATAAEATFAAAPTETRLTERYRFWFGGTQ